MMTNIDKLQSCELAPCDYDYSSSAHTHRPHARSSAGRRALHLRSEGRCSLVLQSNAQCSAVLSQQQRAWLLKSNASGGAIHRSASRALCCCVGCHYRRCRPSAAATAHAQDAGGAQAVVVCGN